MQRRKLRGSGTIQCSRDPPSSSTPVWMGVILTELPVPLFAPTVRDRAIIFAGPTPLFQPAVVEVTIFFQLKNCKIKYRCRDNVPSGTSSSRRRSKGLGWQPKSRCSLHLHLRYWLHLRRPTARRSRHFALPVWLRQSVECAYCTRLCRCQSIKQKNSNKSRFSATCTQTPPATPAAATTNFDAGLIYIFGDVLVYECLDAQEFFEGLGSQFMFEVMCQQSGAWSPSTVPNCVVAQQQQEGNYVDFCFLELNYCNLQPRVAIWIRRQPPAEPKGVGVAR